MKIKAKIFFLTTFALIACSKTKTNNFGPGATNAVQYLMENHPEWGENVEQAEVIAEDSLLTDRGVRLDAAKLAMKSLSVYEGKVSKKEFMALLDSTGVVLWDIGLSWKGQDSLSRLEKYKDILQKVYTIKIKMKSGAEYHERVLMERDGVTPRSTENEFLQDLNKHNMDLIRYHQNHF